MQDTIRKYEFIPQAILNEPVSVVAQRLGAKVQEGSDDFDFYLGAAGALDDFPGLGKVPFTVMHYRGHPDGTTTIYLPFNIQGIARITEIISKILADLEFSSEALRWQRWDDPDL